MMEMKRGVNKNGWRILGPGGGGAQYIPTIKPDDPDTALVACDMTGVYITHNGGQGWTQLNFKAWMRSFAFAPSRSETIYAGGTGLYRSNDIGKNWYLVFPNRVQSPQRITQAIMRITATYPVITGQAARSRPSRWTQ